jgi:hypothetical protein
MTLGGGGVFLSHTNQSRDICDGKHTATATAGVVAGTTAIDATATATATASGCGCGSAGQIVIGAAINNTC